METVERKGICMKHAANVTLAKRPMAAYIMIFSETFEPFAAVLEAKGWSLDDIRAWTTLTIGAEVRVWLKAGRRIVHVTVNANTNQLQNLAWSEVPLYEGGQANGFPKNLTHSRKDVILRHLARV